MDRIAARANRCGDHRRDVQIAIARHRRTDADRAIRQACGERVAIRAGHADHAFEPERTARANNADCDFAAIGDEDASDTIPDHAGSI